MSTFWQNRRHARVRTLLSSYIDGEVSASEARRVTAHLSGCDECSAELESLRATTTLLGRLPSLDTPRSYALTAADVQDMSPRRGLPSFAAFSGGLATAGAAALVVVLVVGVVFLARLGFTGSAAESRPQAAAAPVVAQAPAAPAAPAPAAVAPAAAAPAAAMPAPALQSAAPAPPMAAAAPQPAPAAPAAQATSAPAAAAMMVGPQPTPAPQAAAPAAPPVRAAQESEEVVVKAVVKAVEIEAMVESDSKKTATFEVTFSEATVTAEAHVSAQATYEAEVVEAQVAATAAVQEQVKYATALAQWEAEQRARTQERAQQQAAAQATHEAQVADSYAAATAAVAQDLAIRATAQAEQAEARAAERSAQGELMIPVWALVVVGVGALAAVAAIAIWRARRRLS